MTRSKGSRIDFNCDMGESFGMYEMGYDGEVIKYISSANIACGFHAGDPVWMRKTVALAEQHGVGIGAHPSYPDLVGFGRRNMNLSPEEVKADLTYQIGALQAFTSAKKLQHIKPHGAMYNQAVNDESLARAICEAVLEVQPDLVLLALAGSRWIAIAEDMGLRVAREIFADRALNPDGTLVSRSKSGSVIHDASEVAERSLRMVTEGIAVAITGEEIMVQAESLCLHGDTPGAVEMAKRVRNALEVAGVEITPLGQLV
ncbi:MAG: LamB/YcsF family protein [Chloroflexi bacterium]|nr:LamB/YcsF family protein [Chloroflexota bacterium]